MNVTLLLVIVAVGLKAAVTPLGKPVTPRFTLPVNPFWSATVSVPVPVLACLTLSAAAEAERVNEGPPDVPVRS